MLCCIAQTDRGMEELILVGLGNLNRFLQVSSIPHPKQKSKTQPPTTTHNTQTNKPKPKMQQQHTTHNTQQQAELPPTYAPAGFGPSFDGNIHHGPKSWFCCSLWVHARRTALGSLLPLFVPSFGASTQAISKSKRDADPAML